MENETSRRERFKGFFRMLKSNQDVARCLFDTREELKELQSRVEALEQAATAPRKKDAA